MEQSVTLDANFSKIVDVFDKSEHEVSLGEPTSEPLKSDKVCSLLPELEDVIEPDLKMETSS